MNKNIIREKISQLYKYISSSYYHVGLNPIRHILLTLISLTIFIGILLYTLIFSNNSIILEVILIAIGFLITIVISTYPVYKMQKANQKIDFFFQRFITHITVLSLTNINRVEVFRSISRDKEGYGPLADELSKFVMLIDYFNLSLDDAARRRAEETQSEIMSEFYERLSYNVGSGENLSNFLLSQQESYRSEYNSKFKAKLQITTLLGNAYVSIIISGVYIYLVASILPMLANYNQIIVLTASLGFIIMIQILFVFLMSAVTTRDRLWYHPEEGTKTEWLIYISFAIATLLGIFSAAILYFFQLAPTNHFYYIAITLPYIIPSFFIYRKENSIEKSDRNYPNFIKSLSSIESVRNTSTRRVLKTIKEKDFGVLSEKVENLYKRLWLNINNERAWNLFCAEISSDLIKKHSDMYVTGKRMGGEPKKLGETISNNALNIISLRQEKQTTETDLRTKMYGIVIISALAIFLALEVVQSIVEIQRSISEPSGGADLGLLNVQSYDVQLIENVVIGFQFINICLSSLIIRLIGQRNILGVVLHISMLTPIVMLIGYFASTTISPLLT